MADERRYSEREVQAILERAVVQDRGEGLTHDDLLAAAREAGISTEAVEKAALEVDGWRAQDAARDRILARRRAGFFSHLWAFIAVQLFLLALNLITSPGYLWFVFPLLGWGLGLFFAARQGLSKTVSDRALSRELAKARWALASPRRGGPALAQPSARLRAREPSLERDVVPTPSQKTQDSGDARSADATRHRS